MADDYRERYLNTERALLHFKDTAARERGEAVKKTEQKLGKLMDEEREEYLRRMQDKDLEIERL